MIAIVDGDLYQWDTGRYISLDDDYDWVDFKVRGVDECLRVESPGETVQIPNVTLTNSGRLIVYLGSIDDDGSQTVVTSEFCIIARPKPVGYQADADDHLNWEKLHDKVVSDATTAVTPYVTSASGYATAAQQSASSASSSASSASSSASAASTSAQQATAAAESIHATYVTPAQYKQTTDTDDTSSIQRAVNAAEASATITTVYIPAGEYSISSPIVITKGIKFIGDNANPKNNYYKTVIKTTVAGITAIDVNGAANASISGIRIVGTDTGDNSCGITLRGGAIGAEIRNVSVYGLGAGFNITDSWAYIISHCRTDSCATGYNIAAGTNCSFEACTAYKSSYGFKITKSTYTAYSACGTDGCLIGFDISGNCRGITLVSCGSENVQRTGTMIHVSGSNVVATITAFSVGKAYNISGTQNKEQYDIIKIEDGSKITLTDLTILTTNYVPDGKIIKISGETSPTVTLVNPYFGEAISAEAHGDVSQCSIVGGNLDSSYVKTAPGKGLSSNDYTSADKGVVDSLDVDAVLPQVLTSSYNTATGSITVPSRNIWAAFPYDDLPYCLAGTTVEISPFDDFNVGLQTGLYTSNVASADSFISGTRIAGGDGTKTYTTAQDGYLYISIRCYTEDPTTHAKTDILLTDDLRSEILSHLSISGKGRYAKDTDRNFRKIRQDLANYLEKPASPQVGQYLKISAINDDGSVVLENVDLPIATFSEYGLAKFSSDGFVFGSEGKVFLATPTSSNITSRKALRAVMINKLDDCVKAAMCDGKGADWGATEQASALARLGITVDSDGICHFG